MIITQQIAQSFNGLGFVELLKIKKCHFNYWSDLLYFENLPMCYITHTSKICIVLYLEEKEPINH